MNSNGASSCKVVLLGETGVGKTSIINRYINNVYNTDSMSTSGASFAAKTMFFEEYDKNHKFEIWDTAGQEKFRSLTKMFYKDAAVAVLVYDITRKGSFEEVKNYWLPQLKEHAPKKIIYAIAANKGDLYEHEEVEESKGRNYAKEIGAIFRYTSAKNASGIDDLFKSIGCKYIDPNYQEGGKVEPNENEPDRERSKTVKIGKDTNKKDKKEGCSC